jgi:carbohydrate-binding DOMON domain-containing protein
VASAHDNEFVLFYDTGEGSTQLNDIDHFELANLLAAQKHLKYFALKFFEEKRGKQSLLLQTHQYMCNPTRTHTYKHRHTHTQTHTHAHTHTFTYTSI